MTTTVDIFQIRIYLSEYSTETAIDYQKSVQTIKNN